MNAPFTVAQGVAVKALAITDLGELAVSAVLNYRGVACKRYGPMVTKLKNIGIKYESLQCT